MSLKNKIILLFVILIVIANVGLGFYTVNSISNKVIEAAQEKLIGDLALGKALIDEIYPGEWSIKEGNLYKGNVIMNNSYIVDKIGNLTGDTVTIFQGDTRIATNVIKDDGNRAVGTQVSEVVGNTVLKEGKQYIGKANVVGVWNQTAYEPIKNAKGDIIGIWYVGVPNTVYDEIANNFRNTFIVFVAITIIITIIIMWFAVGKISKPLVMLEGAANEIALGKLNSKIEVTSNDEIGKLSVAFKKMEENLKSLINHIANTVKSLETSSQQMVYSANESTAMAEQMGETIDEIANEAVEKAATVEQTQQIIKEMSDSMQQVAKNTHTTNEQGKKVEDATEKGKRTVNEAIKILNEAQGIMKQSVEASHSLDKNSKEISNIIQIITNITDQTNLLALNAAIEAARAGEQGKGFAVVADEVRKLAEESSNAASKIAQLIGDVQGGVGKTVELMDKGAAVVEDSTKAVLETRNAFDEIHKSINIMVTDIDEISAVTQQMSTGSNEIVLAMDNVSELTEKSAANTQQASSVTQEQKEYIKKIASNIRSLANISEELKKQINKFEI